MEDEDEDDGKPIYLVPIFGGDMENMGSVVVSADTPAEAVTIAIIETMKLFSNRPLTNGVVERLR